MFVMVCNCATNRDLKGLVYDESSLVLSHISLFTRDKGSNKTFPVNGVTYLERDGRETPLESLTDCVVVLGLM